MTRIQIKIINSIKEDPFSMFKDGDVTISVQSINCLLSDEERTELGDELNIWDGVTLENGLVTIPKNYFI